MELGCGGCLYREPEEGASVCVPNNGRLGSGTFCTERRDETAVEVSSALAVLVRTGLLGRGAAAGSCGLSRELRAVGVMGRLLARLYTVSASCDVAGEAAGGLSSF